MAATKAGQIIIARGTSNPAFAQLTGCSVTRSGTTATLTKASHGLSNGDHPLIQGFELEEFNGIFAVANATANTFDYTIKQDPGANPSGSAGTVDKATLGAALDMSTDYGGYLVGGIQNGNTAPNDPAQIWMGIASSGTADADYLWSLCIVGDIVANSFTPFRRPLDAGMMSVNIAICRNTAQPVDCYMLASHITAG